jgi:multiple sugar transport system ATP-binding protein
MARVRLAEVSKTYRRGTAPVFALRGLTLEVAEGELLAVVGPSGCGKTSLLRTVAGLERPDSGNVYFGDRDVTRLPPERRAVGFVFQRPALYPHASIYDNIAFGPRARRVAAGETEARVRAAAARMRVDDELLAQRPRELSGGQQQRVALARALAIDPDVLLLDEPLSGLDAQLRAELRVELARVHNATGATTLFVTHDQSEALSLGQRVAVMRDGSIEQLGAPRELYDTPLNSFVAGFIGTPSMALLKGSIGAGRFVADGGGLACASGAQIPGAATAGFRAEHVALDPQGEVRGIVRVVEDIGSDGYAYVEGTYGALVARLGADEPRPHSGDSVNLTLDAARAHFFDSGGARR